MVLFRFTLTTIYFMVASPKKNTNKSSVVPADILKGYEQIDGRTYLKHSRKFASFPELLGMQEK